MNQACSLSKNMPLRPRTNPQVLFDQVYQTNYILSALHYALALQLNQHHQRLLKRQIKQGRSKPAASRRKGPTTVSIEPRKNTSFKLITPNQCREEKLDRFYQQTAKMASRTQAEDLEVSSLSRESLRPSTLPPTTIINQKHQVPFLNTQKPPNGIPEPQESELASVDQQEDAYLPPWGLAVEELRARRERLMEREVESWSCKKGKVKMAREIKGLMR